MISLCKWLEQVGVTPCTAWRWRKKGWLKTINIAGRQYLTQDAIDEFHRHRTDRRGATVRAAVACAHQQPFGSVQWYDSGKSGLGVNSTALHDLTSYANGV